MRIAQVASAMSKTSPTSDAAVITPTESALFCKKPLGALSPTAVADADPEDEEDVADVGGRVAESCEGGDVGADVWLCCVRVWVGEFVAGG